MSTDNAIMIAIAGYFKHQKTKPRFNKKANDKVRAEGNLSL